MNFFIENETFLMVIGMLTLVILATFVAIPYLKKKGVLNQANVDAIQSVLSVAQLIVGNIAGAGKVSVILKSAEAAVGYVEQTMKLEDNDAKKQSAEEATIKLLQHEGIVINDKMKELIEIGIQSAVKALPKTDNTNNNKVEVKADLIEIKTDNVEIIKTEVEGGHY